MALMPFIYPFGPPPVGFGRQAPKLPSRFEQEQRNKDGKKAVCKKHDRAYVISVGCPYCG